jgi:hypothetical protein
MRHLSAKDLRDEHKRLYRDAVKSLYRRVLRDPASPPSEKSRARHKIEEVENW